MSKTSLEKYLARRLFVDPDGHVDLHTVVNDFRRLLPEHERPLWPAARIKLDLGPLIGSRDENGRTITTVRGYAAIDPVEARRAAEQAERLRREVEQARSGAELEAELEGHRARAAAADALQVVEAREAIRREISKNVNEWACRRITWLGEYVEYAPGDNLLLEDVATAFNRRFPVEECPNGGRATRGLTARDVYNILTITTRHSQPEFDPRWVTPTHLKDHRWAPAMLLADGRARSHRWSDDGVSRKRKWPLMRLDPNVPCQLLVDTVAAAPSFSIEM